MASSLARNTRDCRLVCDTRHFCLTSRQKPQAQSGHSINAVRIYEWGGEGMCDWGMREPQTFLDSSVSHRVLERLGVWPAVSKTAATDPMWLVSP